MPEANQNVIFADPLEAQRRMMALAEENSELKKSAAQERDKIVRWLKCQVQALHTDIQSNPDIRAVRDAASSVISRIALDIEEGKHSKLTTRDVREES